ncbi:unnamed protein product [Linum trigynum]|uniref:F-box domain-containing protein n=1 Tax=Linum trigynum TaxID=586398 RepID=A0AAV2G8L4_9ROSI
METRSAKRKKQLCFPPGNDHGGASQIDRITDLPDPLLHHILSYLPIRSIAQTSALSRRWRLLWSTLPDLDFTTAAAIKRSSIPPNSYISTVLSLRHKHSDLRSLRFSARLTFSTLNSLIRLAVRHRVQYLDVEVSTDDYFNFPRGVIASETLRTFKLKSRCPGFRLLPSSVMASGFRNLDSLSLSLVTLHDQQSSLLDLFTETSFPCLRKLDLDTCFELRHLKVGCRALEDFSIENCFHLRGLEICCAKLTSLRVASCFDAYCDETRVEIRNGSRIRFVAWEQNAITGKSAVEELRAVREASIGFFVDDYDDICSDKLHSVCSFMSGFSRADSLTLDSQCIEILSSSKYSAQFVHPIFSDVRTLELHTGFNKKNVAGLAFLFRSTPTLHTLVLKIMNDHKTERRQWNKDLWDVANCEQEQYWESQVQSLSSFLNHLKIVKIHGFLEYENEVSLAKFLLKHGKDLQEMTLSTPHHCNYRDSLRRQKVRSQMMGFSWASSNAKISFQ